MCSDVIFDSRLQSCKSCAAAEIPDDVVNFFNNRHSSVLRQIDDDDDDVGLLQLDSEATGESGTVNHADAGNVLPYCSIQ